MNVPYRHDATATINIVCVWVYDNAAADADKFVRWACDYTPVANGETIAGAATTKITGDQAGLNVDVGKRKDTQLDTGMIAGNTAPHDQVSLRLYRDATADDYPHDARLIGVHIIFTMNKLGLTA